MLNLWDQIAFYFPRAVTILLAIDFILAFVIIFLERKNPSATMAWLCILFLLPVAGIFLYALLSQNIARQRVYKLSKDEKWAIDKIVHDQSEEMDKGSFAFSTKEGKVWRDMVKLNQTYGNAYYTQNNSIRIITDGNEMLDSMLADIENAEHSVNVQFYIIKNDFAGQRLLNLLTKKAAEGLEVRLLMDPVGCRTIFDKTLREFKKAGGKYAFFFKPKLRLANMKLNYRNHRKIVVIDGEIGYVGGFNVGREYLGQKKKFGYWRDTHLRIMGGAVNDLYGRFILDWRTASKEDFPLNRVMFTPPVDAGETGIQIVSCGPDSAREEVKRAFMKMITSAQENIYIQTPYFVPDGSILESLKMAAQSGVDVRVMIPCMPDHIFVYWATYSYVGELLRSGCRVFLYQNGFLHAKTIAVDGEISSVGSTNFDIRSFKLNFETNAFIFDGDKTRRLEEIFEKDIENSEELTLAAYKKRSLIIKFKESISRLLSDIL